MQKLHEDIVQELQNQVKTHYGQCSALCLNKTTLKSNTTRSSDYKKAAGARLNVDSLNRILKIDPERLIATCEPRVTMLQLAKETMRYGLIPRVVPEFKGITVGGAIMGCGGESSSFKHGLFHDICPRLKILLGDGSVVWASPEENRDLYQAVHGSYGSLGVVLAAEISLEQALPFVNLTYRRQTSAEAAIKDMRASIHQPIDFLEGLILGSDEAVVIEGKMSATCDHEVFSDRPWSPWYYSHAKCLKRERCTMPLLDYIFRYDKGAFWMGSYVLRPGILRRFLMQGILKLQKGHLPWLNSKLLEKYSHIYEPGMLCRLLSSWAMSSQRLYSLLHAGEEWVKDRLIIQDFTLPESNAQDFLDEVQQRAGIYPLWLCPIRTAESGQIFAPNIAKSDAYTINVGVYGLPKTIGLAVDVLSQLENQAALLGGRKWLYTHSCYTLDDFWQIYPEEQYRKLRQKYNADGIWMSIENKVLSN